VGRGRVRDICRLAWRAYRGAPWRVRLLMTARPLICPLEVAAEAVPEGSRVLDIGCGAGLWLRWLAADRRIARGVGVDISVEAVAAARAGAAAGEDGGRETAAAAGTGGGPVGAARAGRGAEAAASDGAAAVLCFRHIGPGEPWPAEPVDVVTAIDVLHHVPPEDQRAFVGRLAAVGAGRVLIKDVAPRPRWRAWANALHDYLMTRSRVHPRTPEEVAGWLREEGLEVARVERLPRACYAHWLVVADRPGGMAETGRARGVGSAETEAAESVGRE